jgi:hypothetical protein
MGWVYQFTVSARSSLVSLDEGAAPLRLFDDPKLHAHLHPMRVSLIESPFP